MTIDDINMTQITQTTKTANMRRFYFSDERSEYKSYIDYVKHKLDFITSIGPDNIISVSDVIRNHGYGGIEYHTYIYYWE